MRREYYQLQMKQAREEEKQQQTRTGDLFSKNMASQIFEQYFDF